MDEAAVMKRGFRSKIELAEEICTDDQLAELRRFLRDRTEDWEQKSGNGT